VKRGRRLAAIVPGLTLLVLLGSTLLLSLRIYVWDALLFLILAFVPLSYFVVKRRERKFPPLFPRSCLDWRPRTAEGWLRGIALVFSVFVMFLCRWIPDGESYAIPLLIWLVGLLCYVVPFLVALLRTPWIRPSMTRWEWGGLLLLVAIAGGLRGIELGSMPYSLGGDEGTQLVAGLDLVRDPIGNPFATGWYSVPTMSFFAYGLVTRVFGATIAGGRVLSVLLGSATVVFTFFLARLMDGRWVGWWSAVMLTVSAYHIHFSRLASNQIGDPLIGTLGLGLLWVGYNAGERQRLRDVAWGLAGVVAGLGWYGYFGARWVTIMMALFLLWRILTDPFFVIRHRRALWLAVLGGLVALLPLLGWYQAHPSAMTERYNAVSIFASGWLSREQELTGRSAVFLMGQQLWKAFTAFHLTPDPTFWYRPGRPLVDFVTGALLLLGIAVAFLQVRRPIRGLILLWLFSTVLMAWGVTENPPSSQRGVLLAPVISILAAWGLREALKILGFEHPVHLWFASGVLAAILVLNVGFYFAVYIPRRVYGNPTAEIATAIGHYQRDNPHPICAPEPDGLCEGRVYFLGAPSLYWHFGTLAYLARGVPGEDVLPEERPASVVPPARFIVTPNRAEDLAWIESSYPHGDRTYLRAPDGRLLAIIYDWSAH
jgi:hypothetical protein